MSNKRDSICTLARKMTSYYAFELG